MEQFLGRDVGGPSVMLRRGGAAVIALILLAAFATAYARGTFRSSVEVHTLVTDAGGSLLPGADVKARGVIVGKATKIELVKDKVRITLVLKSDDASHIPANVVARVLPATVFGTSYIDLADSKTPSSEALRAGQLIEQDQSAETLELQTTLDSLYRVVTAVQPAELATTLTAISTALDGRGAQIGESMTRLDTFLTTLEPRLPLLQEDIKLLADNLETLDMTGPQLLDAVDDGLVTARTITANRSNVTAIITGAGALVDGTESLLTDEERRIAATLDQTATVTDILFDGRDQLVPGLRNFVSFARLGSTTLGDGSFLNTDSRFTVSDKMPYTAADCPRFGTASGPNCAGGGSAGTKTTSAASPAEAGIDAAIVAQVRERLKTLDSTSGVGELLARPFIGATP